MGRVYTIDDIPLLLDRLRIAEERVQNLEIALRDAHTGLAAALLKNGGSMEFNYADFFNIRKSGEFEFLKHENYNADSVTISIKKVKPPE